MKQWNLTKLSKYLINVLSKPTEDHTMLGVKKQMHNVGRAECRVQEDQEKCEDVMEKLSVQFWTLWDASQCGESCQKTSQRCDKTNNETQCRNGQQPCWKPLGDARHNGTKPMIRRNEKEERTPSRRLSGGRTSSHRKERGTRRDSVAAPKRRLDVPSSQETKQEKGPRRGTEVAAGRPPITRTKKRARTPSRHRSGGWASWWWRCLFGSGGVLMVVGGILGV
ncbi:hypothetical protein IW262DRAFT_1477806 [Armillaria fumosa]|nr:hypothetical protein IW262DRAFT_1477806 [Armillaria fumosa]